MKHSTKYIKELWLWKKAIAWFEICVDDLDRATKFYETVLETKLEPLGDPTDKGLKVMSFPGDMESCGANGALVKVDGMKAGGNSTLVYFGCDDCAVEEARI